MAKKPLPSDAPKAPKTEKKGGGGFWAQILVMLALTALVLVSLPTVVVMLFGMMPSVVAYVIDRSPQKYQTFSVGAMNFCGVFPYVYKVWSAGGGMGKAIATLTDVFVLLVMYGSAAFGWMLFALIPPVIVSFMRVVNERRIAELRDKQKELIEEWGQDIAQVQDAPLRRGQMPKQVG